MFVALALAVLVGVMIFWAVGSARDRSRAAVFAPLQDLSTKLARLNNDKKLACQHAARDLIKRTFPNGLDKAAALTPTNLAPLRNTQFLSLQEELTVRSAGGFVDGTLDCEPLPPTVRAKALAHGSLSLENAEVMTTYLGKVLPSVEQFTTPATVGAASCSYDRKLKAWFAAFAWVSAKDARPLAIVKVRAPSNAPLGWCASAATVAVAVETSGWR